MNNDIDEFYVADWGSWETMAEEGLLLEMMSASLLQALGGEAEKGEEKGEEKGDAEVCMMM